MGWRLDGFQRERLEACLAQRLKALEIHDLPAYLALLQTEGGQAEQHQLFSLLTIQESSFFRHREQLDTFTQHVLPALRAQRRDAQSLRVWSAGCSTGEEPYTLAMLLNESGFSDWEWDVLATDINPAYLQHAREGIYSSRAVANVPAAWRNAYFRVAGAGQAQQFVSPVAQRVRFAKFNLMNDAYPAPLPATHEAHEAARWDVIFCRNVLIYFTPDMIREVVKKFAGVLADDGYLFLGFSENLKNISSEWTPELWGETFVYRKAAPRGSTRALALPRTRAHAVSPLTGEPPAVAPRPRVQSPPPVPGKPRHRVNRAATGSTLPADRAPQSTTDSTASRVSECSRLLNAGEAEAALELARSWAGGEPLSGAAQYWLGVVAARVDEEAQALTALRRSLYLEPSAPATHFELGHLYRRQQRPQEALRAWQTALRLLRDWPEEQPLSHGAELSAAMLSQGCAQEIARLEAENVS
jgi:chemotaxis protein methyltransferase CheR